VQFTSISPPQIAHFHFTSFHSTKHAIPTNIKMATNLPTVVSQALDCTPNPNMTATFSRREGSGKLTRAGGKQEAHTQRHYEWAAAQRAMAGDELTATKAASDGDGDGSCSDGRAVPERNAGAVLWFRFL
jgi:hypothetical protein